MTVFSVQHSRRNIVLYHCRCNHLFSMITRSLLHNFLRKIIIITFCSLLSHISPKTCLQANIRIYRDKRVFSQHRIKVHNTKIGSFKIAIFMVYVIVLSLSTACDWYIMRVLRTKANFTNFRETLRRKFLS